jgi:heat shock protein HspQ
MLDTNQIPFLLKLLEDEDPAVREPILDALAAFGPDLDEALAGLPDPLEPEAVEAVKAMVEAHLRHPESDPGPGELERRMRFRPGQLVRHRRYGYRGVVVDGDTSCQADEAWYQSNRTRPERTQPWYHVLVHNSMQVTYAAQSNLEPDDTGDEVVHPYVPYFFSEFRDGEYVRNDQPWPS